MRGLFARDLPQVVAGGWPSVLRKVRGGPAGGDVGGGIALARSGEGGAEFVVLLPTG
ncbi:hypothetical protein ACIQBJ_03275 [Kitasatospora sp. NPDC088391]|uniref:hypothetical protein n=1 Tax=Kitasatospora sp. NPDC088391 TaxID=3364074 RepID=UPI0037FDBD02